MTTREADADLWVRRYVPSPGARTRLVCFPHAGGSASYFAPLARSLAPAVDVVSLQYPGRQDRRREPLVPTVAEYADRLADVLGTLEPAPTVYFGHSLGAVLAFEVTLRLGSSEAAPSRLVASGRRGPGTVRDEAVHLRDDGGILAEMTTLDGTSSALLRDEEVIRMALPAIRADYRAVETYVCPDDRVVGCPVTVLIGADDPTSTLDEAREWERHTTGAFRLRAFPGGHFYLAAQAAAVGEELRTELAAALSA